MSGFLWVTRAKPPLLQNLPQGFVPSRVCQGLPFRLAGLKLACCPVACHGSSFSLTCSYSSASNPSSRSSALSRAELKSFAVLGSCSSRRAAQVGRGGSRLPGYLSIEEVRLLCELGVCEASVLLRLGNLSDEDRGSGTLSGATAGPKPTQRRQHQRQPELNCREKKGLDYAADSDRNTR